jgi:hypothetical protein
MPCFSASNVTRFKKGNFFDDSYRFLRVTFRNTPLFTPPAIQEKATNHQRVGTAPVNPYLEQAVKALVTNFDAKNKAFEALERVRSRRDYQKLFEMAQDLLQLLQALNSKDPEHPLVKDYLDDIEFCVNKLYNPGPSGRHFTGINQPIPQIKL